MRKVNTVSEAFVNENKKVSFNKTIPSNKTEKPNQIRLHEKFFELNLFFSNSKNVLKSSSDTKKIFDTSFLQCTITAHFCTFSKIYSSNLSMLKCSKSFIKKRTFSSVSEIIFL